MTFKSSLLKKNFQLHLPLRWSRGGGRGLPHATAVAKSLPQNAVEYLISIPSHQDAFERALGECRMPHCWPPLTLVLIFACCLLHTLSALPQIAWHIEKWNRYYWFADGQQQLTKASHILPMDLYLPSLSLQLIGQSDFANASPCHVNICNYSPPPTHTKHSYMHKHMHSHSYSYTI